jgi:hypothetical protein
MRGASLSRHETVDEIVSGYDVYQTRELIKYRPWNNSSFGVQFPQIRGDFHPMTDSVALPVANSANADILAKSSATSRWGKPSEFIRFSD